jgi:ATP-dependent Clp protease ATP-binding subunit ClpA
LDEGRLTDRYGRTTTFRNTILIMTSNLGVSRGSSIGLRPQAEQNYEAAARRFFRPEFFNRLDSIVAFRPLTKEVCLAIVRKELEEVGQRAGLRKLGIRLRFTDAVIEHLLQIGFDPRFGARPLQRAIEETVVAQLARMLVDHPGLRHSTLRVELDPQGACQVATD